MTVYSADDFIAISKRRREIRKAEGLGDDNWRTASDADLDTCAAVYDIYRSAHEYDTSLRARIQAVVDNKRATKLFL